MNRKLQTQFQFYFKKKYILFSFTIFHRHVICAITMNVHFQMTITEMSLSHSKLHFDKLFTLFTQNEILIHKIVIKSLRIVRF